MKYKCPCCGYYTFESPLDYTYDICPICFWEDDGLQLMNPNEGGGANKVSLNQARENYKEFGAGEYEMKKHVRAAGVDDEICADISELLIEQKKINYPGLSIEGHLEVVCGNYYVDGNPEEFEYVHYPIPNDNFNVNMLNPESIVAIISESKGLAFVLDSIYDEFCNDTADYNFIYIRIDNLLEKNMSCLFPERLPEEYKNIVWINDDFLNDESIEFDYEAFEKIDSGVDYLNPRNYSMYEFTKYINKI